VEPGEDRPRKAIEIASAWVNGEASIEDVRKASAAAASASYAANAYAYAANARTLVLAECADIVRKEIPQPYTERP
jgi:hypothetical protein